MLTRIFGLQIVVLLISIIAALGMTASYGKLKHDRYYVTIEKVQKTQIDLSISLLTLLEREIRSENKILITDLEKAFEPVRYYTLIKVYQNDTLFFENSSRFKSTKLSNFKTFELGDLRFEFGIYAAPAWFFDNKAFLGIGSDATFWRWLGDPINWFSGQYDFIHVPFISFLGLFYFFMFALAYRFRANYLSKKVIATLKEIKDHQSGRSL